jgi:hypothetical protein
LRLCSQLKDHGYHGIGRCDPEFPEIVVFNPSRVSAVSVHRYRYDELDGWLVKGLRLSKALTAETIKESLERSRGRNKESQHGIL